jgi:hypothetical protein
MYPPPSTRIKENRSKQTNKKPVTYWWSLSSGRIPLQILEL